MPARRPPFRNSATPLIAVVAAAMLASGATAATTAADSDLEFGTAGELRTVADARPVAQQLERGNREFLPNLRVDDDLNPEHREPVVVWGPNGVLCAAYAERATHYNPELIMFTRSSDGGLTWLAPAVRINDTQPNAVVFPAIETLADGTLLIVWAEMKFAPYNYEIRFARSTDGGDTWSPSVVIHPLDPTTDFYRPAILVVGDRILVSYWEEVSYPDGVPVLVYSDDGGASWCDPITITTMFCDYGGAAPGLAYDLDLGILGVVVPTHQERIYFLHSTDLGDVWSAPAQINDAVATSANYPDLAAGGGLFYALWNDNRISDADIWISHSVDGIAWSTNVRVNDDLISGNQYEPHLRIDDRGNLHACWIWNLPFQSNIDLYYSASQDGGLTWLPVAQRVNDIPYIVQPYVAWTSDLLADDGGNVYILWSDGRDTGYYDNIYFSRQLDPSGIARGEPDGPIAAGPITYCTPHAHPGPAPMLVLDLDCAARVTAEMFDLTGRRCGRRIIRARPAGRQQLALADLCGLGSLPAGIYFARVGTRAQQFLRPLVIVR